MKAIVLIKIQTGEIQNAIQDLRRLSSVADAQMTFGPYDAIVLIDTQDLKSLGKLVSWDIQTIPGVRETCTCVMVDADLPDGAEAVDQQETLFTSN
jgi:DNA-binding Lrp family transcriptional regulator